MILLPQIVQTRFDILFVVNKPRELTTINRCAFACQKPRARLILRAIKSNKGRTMNNARRTFSLACGLILISTSLVAPGQDWPQWRGPNRDDKVTGFTAPKTWPQEFHQKWKVSVGQADSTPALAGGRLYVFSRQDDKEVTQCLDAATGKEIWSDKYEAMAATGPAQQHPGPRSSPTVAEGKVITLGARGVLSCLDAADGKLVWRKNDVQGWPNFFTSMSPLVVNGLCIAQLGSKTNGALIAYDLSSGAEKWKWNGDGAGLRFAGAHGAGRRQIDRHANRQTRGGGESGRRQVGLGSAFCAIGHGRQYHHPHR